VFDGLLHHSKYFLKHRNGKYKVEVCGHSDSQPTYKLHAAQSFLKNNWSLSWSRNLPHFHETPRLITVFTKACHLPLPWVRQTQSTFSYPISFRFILIVSSHLHLGLPSGFFLSDFPTTTLYAFLLFPTHATCPTHRILLHLWGVQSMNLLIMQFSPVSCYFIPLRHKYASQHSVLEISSVYILPSIWQTKFHTHTKQEATL